MSEAWNRLPKDWRTALAVAVLTAAGIASARTWVVAIASAQDAPQRAAIEEMQPMVRELYVACVHDGRCSGEALKRGNK